MATAPISPHLVRVAAVWGTTVVALKNLGDGQSFDMTSGPESVLPVPDGVAMSELPVRAAPGGWEVDAKGVVSGILKLRGRDEDPVAFAQSGAPIPIVPGDYGLLQYGQFGIFFSSRRALKRSPDRGGPSSSSRSRCFRAASCTSVSSACSAP